VGVLVTEGAMLMCPFGKVPVPLAVTPRGPRVASHAAVATVADFVPMTNIMTFGVCNSPGNPACANPSGSAPCVPAVVSPWTPGSLTTKIGGVPALTSESACMCTFGGRIMITSPGASAVTAK